MKKRSSGDFDLLAARRSLYAGVIAEEGPVGTSETVVGIAQDKLKRLAADAQIGETSTVK